jgi:hypothetical protein
VKKQKEGTGKTTTTIGIIAGATNALAYSIHNMVVQMHNTKLKGRLST